MGMHRRSHADSTTRCAVVLLLVVLAHLAFMATPLHAAMIDPAEGMLTPIERDQTDARPAETGEVVATDHQIEHCALTWSLPSPGVLQVDATSWDVPSRIPPLANTVAAARPVPQAIGPPVVADPQALLQVFRV
jgi:hypothetical protein